MVKSYTIEQVANFLGVRENTINTWIAQERFVNIPPQVNNKQTEIPENALWKSPMGQIIPISEVVEMYETDCVKPASEEELNNIKEQLDLYESKYNGKFEDLLNKEDKTEEEVHDTAQWKYCLWRWKHEQQNR